MNKQVRPIAALTHPLWILGLVVLALNDHILKAADLAPAMSGKISDFAGLLIAPALLATLVGVRRRGGLIACAIATGVVFSFINTSVTIAAGWDALVSMVVPYRTTVDPTDLVALLMLPLGIVVFGSAMESGAVRSRKRRAAQLALAVIGLVFCVATSEDESCTTDGDCADGGVCENEWCEYPPRECASEADCPEDYLECAQGICSYQPVCSSNDQCESSACTGGRCELQGVPVGAGSNMSVEPMMDQLEEDAIDLQTLDEIARRPITGIDPVVLDYLSDPATVR